MNKYLARSILALIATALLVPTYFVRVHISGSMLWCGPHTNLCLAVLAVLAVTAMVLAGAALAWLAAYGLVCLSRAAFPGSVRTGSDKRGG